MKISLIVTFELKADFMRKKCLSFKKENLKRICSSPNKKFTSTRTSISYIMALTEKKLLLSIDMKELIKNEPIWKAIFIKISIFSKLKRLETHEEK